MDFSGVDFRSRSMSQPRYATSESIRDSSLCSSHGGGVRPTSASCRCSRRDRSMSARSSWLGRFFLMNYFRFPRAKGKRTWNTKSAEVVVPSMSNRRTRASVSLCAKFKGFPFLRRCGGKISGAHADGLIVPVDAARSVVGNPTRRVLEQANRANRAVAAEVEPVPCLPGHANQITRLDLDGDDGRASRTYVKQTATMNDETHLVIVVPVLTAEFRQHLFQARGLRLDIDHVRCDVAAAGFEPFDIFGVSPQDLVRGCAGSDGAGRLPPFVVYSDAFEMARDLL